MEPAFRSSNGAIDSLAAPTQPAKANVEKMVLEPTAKKLEDEIFWLPSPCVCPNGSSV